jgi:XTP/dITP diphosphohydrolase
MLPQPAATATPEPGLLAGAPLVVATRNPGKLAEFARLLAAHPWRLLSLSDAGVDGDLAEPGPGYADNAVAKAVSACALTGLCALADDSGIEVEALRGWPGPASARWLGPDASDADRLAGLLAEVAERSPGDSRVRFVAAVALARPDAEPVVAHGSCDGVLVEPRGRGGFGYDPGFLSHELGITFAEATAAAKDSVSHRARAIRRLAESGVLDPPAAYL